MPVTASAVAAGIQGVASVAKFVTGDKQVKHGREMARKNVRPGFDIEREYFNNQGLAESMAQQGLSQSSMDYYTTGAERGFTQGADVALQTGAGINAIQQMYDEYNRSLLGATVADARLQQENLRTLMGANKDLAGQKTMQWVLNKYEPYKDRAKAAADEIRAGQQNKQIAAQELVGTASSIATSMLGNDLNAGDRGGAGAERTVSGGATSYTPTFGGNNPRSSFPGFEKWYEEATGDNQFSTGQKPSSIEEITRMLSDSLFTKY